MPFETISKTHVKPVSNRLQALHVLENEQLPPKDKHGITQYYDVEPKPNTA